MKQKIILLAILSLLFMTNVNAQCINGTKSYPIYKMGAQLVETFDNDGAEIVRIEYDLIFSSKESFRNLSSDWEYVIVGFADNGVKDLYVKLYEYDDLLAQWKVVAEDKSTESYAIISYKPLVTALYKVEIIVYEFYEGYDAARYGLMYIHD
jgi:hypothetical protein